MAETRHGQAHRPRETACSTRISEVLDSGTQVAVLLNGNDLKRPPANDDGEDTTVLVEDVSLNRSGPAPYRLNRTSDFPLPMFQRYPNDS